MNTMKRCLRCGNSCTETSFFCENCQSSLLDRSERKPYQTEPMPSPDTKILFATKMIKESDDIDSRELGRRPLPWIQRRTRIRRIRRIFIAVALLIIVALLVDGILATLVLTRTSRTMRKENTFPLLTLNPDVAYLGQAVQLHLTHFSPSSHVLLSRDVRGSLRVDAPSQQILIDASGNATVRILIEGNWGVGAHSIAAEDTSTHYTASVTLQAIGSGPVLPPELHLSQSSLDMGSDWPGANTLHTLALSNKGGGIISWTAKSNQSWLQLTPAQGIFSDRQTLAVAVTRVRMKPGNYEGFLTIGSNTGVPAFVQVKMSIRTLPVSSGAILAITPPVLAFSAIDGDREPPGQTMTIGNPGGTPLSWMMTYSIPTATVNQSIPFQTTNWVSASPASGVLAPHASTLIHIQVHSRLLFPSVYSGTLSIAGRKALDTPQVVALSLNVQQSCGITTDAGMLSFIAATDQQVAHSQNIGLHATPGCPATVAWSAFTLTNWLAVTPANGEVQGRRGGAATVSVDGKLLQSGLFTGLVVFLTEHRTQTINVQLTILPGSSSKKSPQRSQVENTYPGSTPLPNRAIDSKPVPVKRAPPSGNAPPPQLSVSPSQLTFTVSQGQASSGAQRLTFANIGGRSLVWQATISSSQVPWLTLAATQGTLATEQTASLAVDTGAGNLATGTYNAQIVVNALDSSGVEVAGSPQVISITLNVVPPCVAQVTPTALSFSASLLQPNPVDQIIHLSVTGNCIFPIVWQVNGSNNNWLIVSPLSGSENGTGSNINVHIDASGKILGSYNGQITFSAQDNTGALVQISSPTVSVTLDVLG